MNENERNNFNEQGVSYSENNESIEDIESIAEKENTESIDNTNENSYYDSNEINFIMKNDEITKKEKKHGRKRSFAGFVAVALIASLLGGLAGGAIVNYNLKSQANNSIMTSEKPLTQQVKIDLADSMYYAAAVAEKNQKTVVGITTEVIQNVNTFFGMQTQRGQSMGSGMIIDSRGYILTNSHVVGDGQYEDITVSLIDGSLEQGEVLWYETDLDLAIVKIEKTGLPAVELGDSDKLVVGEPVVAIGNPMTLDLERTVTDGIVSGLNRSITFENGAVIEPLIQTNASINSGNSGGPLFNATGEVIGINTAKMQSAEGLGFAIPINTAMPILEQIINTGTYSPVYVGIKGVDVETYERALGVDIIAEYGVVVVETVKDSPASGINLEMGDVITAIDGEKIDSMLDLRKKLFSYKENDKIELSVNRKGEEFKIEMTLKVKPENYN